MLAIEDTEVKVSVLSVANTKYGRYLNGYVPRLQTSVMKNYSLTGKKYLVTIFKEIRQILIKKETRMNFLESNDIIGWQWQCFWREGLPLAA